MTTIQTYTTAAILILSGSIIPAYGQDRGRDHDRDRSDRPGQNQGREPAGAQQAKPQKPGPQSKSHPAPQEDRRTYGRKNRPWPQRQEARPAPEFRQPPAPEQNGRAPGWQYQQDRRDHGPDRYQRQGQEVR